MIAEISMGHLRRLMVPDGLQIEPQ
jgi:hypothetical protein